MFKCNPNREGRTKGYNFDTLRRKNGPDSWGEVGQNNLTRKYIREQMKVGDGVLFYDCSFNPSAVTGIAEVVESFYEDPTLSPEPLVKIQAVGELDSAVSLAQIKNNPQLQDLYRARLLRQSRVCIQPIERREYDGIVAIGKGAQNP